ncbi:S8 family peptidase [Staphylospora marina]|uniref:S8 family peptidase n=1 Tax=Staphylospora marina TaxID=2490858 RepID=UPI0013DDC6CB|nr:S8 family peptidase [Staphylospora marina]
MLYSFVFRSRAMPEKIERIGGTIHHVSRYSPMVIASVPDKSKIGKLLEDPDVIHVNSESKCSLPYYRVERIMAQSKPATSGSRFKNRVTPWNIARVVGPKRWNQGQGIRVGVLDTGIDLNHPNLASNIKGGINIISPSRPPQDDNGHGTHIAGIIGAYAQHAGLLGVAPRVSLYAIKVLDGSGTGSMIHLIKGIEWAISRKLHILNISISGGKRIPPALSQAISAAVRRGILVVAAAGNSGQPSGYGDTVEVPARLPQVISVAAVDKRNRREWYSGTGKVDIAAPGSKILSTYSGGRYAYLSGTSMATAHVTGALAIYKKALPKLSAQELKRVLFARAIDLPPAGVDGWTGHGLVRVR